MRWNEHREDLQERLVREFPLNPRIEKAVSAAARLAAVARGLVLRNSQCPNCATRLPSNIPDYADLRDAIAPYLQVELIKARLEEVRHCERKGVAGRAAELNGELINAYLQIKKD